MADFEELYRELGRRIRQARERNSEGLSQDALAKQLGISRASVVNIEAGRQRAPLHLLWQIAQLLETDLTSLIPRNEELLAPAIHERIDREMMKKIEELAGGDPGTIKLMTGLASMLIGTIEKPHSGRKANEQRKPRK
jgi:transcriptional regulator with XRE-family HTH domain